MCRTQRETQSIFSGRLFVPFDACDFVTSVRQAFIQSQNRFSRGVSVYVARVNVCACRCVCAYVLERRYKTQEAMQRPNGVGKVSVHQSVRTVRLRVCLFSDRDQNWGKQENSHRSLKESFY